MSSEIAPATHAQAASQVQAASQAQSPTQAQPTAASEQAPAAQPAPVPKDVVKLSSAAQAALEEAMETQAQTAKEASGGDAQAKRLLAKQAAEKAELAQKPVHIVA